MPKRGRGRGRGSKAPRGRGRGRGRGRDTTPAADTHSADMEPDLGAFATAFTTERPRPRASPSPPSPDAPPSKALGSALGSSRRSSRLGSDGMAAFASLMQLSSSLTSWDNGGDFPGAASAAAGGGGAGRAGSALMELLAGRPDSAVHATRSTAHVVSKTVSRSGSQKGRAQRSNTTPVPSKMAPDKTVLQRTGSGTPFYETRGANELRVHILGVSSPTDGEGPATAMTTSASRPALDVASLATDMLGESGGMDAEQLRRAYSTSLSPRQSECVDLSIDDATHGTLATLDAPPSSYSSMASRYGQRPERGRARGRGTKRITRGRGGRGRNRSIRGRKGRGRRGLKRRSRVVEETGNLGRPSPDTEAGNSAVDIGGGGGESTMMGGDDGSDGCTSSTPPQADGSHLPRQPSLQWQSSVSPAGQRVLVSRRTGEVKELTTEEDHRIAGVADAAASAAAAARAAAAKKPAASASEGAADVLAAARPSQPVSPSPPVDDTSRISYSMLGGGAPPMRCGNSTTPVPTTNASSTRVAVSRDATVWFDRHEVLVAHEARRHAVAHDLDLADLSEWTHRRLASEFGPTVCAGWLAIKKSAKQNHLFSEWKTRWVELRTCGISMWKGPHGHRTPRAVVRLHADATHQRMLYNDREVVMCKPRQGALPLYFCLASSHEQEHTLRHWDRTLQTCFDGFAPERIAKTQAVAGELRGEYRWWRSHVGVRVEPQAFWDVVQHAAAGPLEDFGWAEAEILRDTFSAAATEGRIAGPDAFADEVELRRDLDEATRPACDAAGFSTGVGERLRERLRGEVEGYCSAQGMTPPQRALFLEGQRHPMRMLWGAAAETWEDGT